MNWDDLRIVAAVTREGTYAGASARLRIDETTVARRLARVERALKLRLFEAADGLRRPTRQCEIVLAHVQAMSRHVAEIDKLSEAVPGLVGRFRIAATNSIAEEILAPRTDRFLVENAGLTLQFLTSNENVNFSRWEADLAIRLRKPERGDFAISKLAEIQFYLVEPIDPVDAAPVICSYSQELDFTQETKFLTARGLQQGARCVTDNIRIIGALIKTRRAIGIVPEYLCKDFLAERQLKVTPLPRPRDVWLLVQSHLKRDPAARLVIDWIRSCFQALPRG
jgi:DNA-binding transcriptional LysR family regulator